MATNPRYRWLGEVSPGEVRRRFGRCHAMVISSRMEGGANVVSEAIVADLPVLASRVPGNVGLLGEGHPACYPRESQARRAPLFTPERERAAWQALLGELG